MKISGSLSAKATPPRSSESQRKSFALTGRSVALDPVTHAVRRDIADVRLAEYVFAPRYSAPMERIVVHTTPLRRARDVTSDILAHLPVGALFEVLEIAGPAAWGIAVGPGLVGYVDGAALDLAADETRA